MIMLHELNYDLDAYGGKTDRRNQATTKTYWLMKRFYVEFQYAEEDIRSVSECAERPMKQLIQKELNVMIDIINKHQKNNFFTKDEYDLVIHFMNNGQEHLFCYWDRVGINDDKKKHLLSTLRKINKTYPGGITGYINKAKRLLHDSKNGINSYSGFIPKQPSIVDLSHLDATFQDMENRNKTIYPGRQS